MLSHPINDPLAGTPYRTLSPLGRGGMGEVVEAEHIALQKRVVVKLLHGSLASRPELVARMQLEGQALARLVHPNLVAVTDFQITRDGRPYLVMERLYGRTLRAELEARGALPVAEAVGFVRQALEGLAMAHEAGIVHRDVKPDNIFVCEACDRQNRPQNRPKERIVKLLDFGIVKVIERENPRAPTPIGIVTEEGVALGTPRLFAPEQARFGAVDARTDIYAMGAVLYTLIVGRSPFDHLTSLVDLLHAHISAPPEPPSRSAKQPILPALEETILKALSKRPEDRFQSAREFEEALARCARPRWQDTEPLPQNMKIAPKPPLPGPPISSRWARTEPLSSFGKALSRQETIPVSDDETTNPWHTEPRHLHPLHQRSEEPMDSEPW